MKKAQSVLMVIALALAPLAGAATTPCLASGTPHDAEGNYIGINPALPDSTQPVAIKVGRESYNLISVAAVVQGNTINVTLTASYIGFTIPPPAGCETVVVGPLAAGSYTVNLFILDPGLPTPTPILATSIPLTVVAAAAGSAPIPTNTFIGLVLITLLLAAIAWRYLRSAPHGR